MTNASMLDGGDCGWINKDRYNQSVASITGNVILL